MNHAIDRRIELEAEKAELEKAIHVIWSSPEPISPSLRKRIEGYEAHPVMSEFI